MGIVQTGSSRDSQGRGSIRMCFYASASQNG